MSHLLNFEDISGTNWMSFSSLYYKFNTGLYIILGKNYDSDKAQSNGSGKSGFTELLPWIIYGEFERDNPSTDGLGNTSGSTTFYKYGIKYHIARYYNHDSYGNGCKIFIDDEDKTPMRIKEQNQKILDIVGIPYSLFTATVTILQNLLVNFSLMTPTIRKQMVENMISATSWEEFKKRFSNKWSIIDREAKVIFENFNTTRDSMIAMSSQLEVSKRFKDTVLLEIKNEITTLTASIRDEKTNLNALLAQSQYNDDSLDIVVKKLSDKRGDYRESISVCKTYWKILNDKVCPTCNEPYDEKKISIAEKIVSDEGEKQVNISNLISKLEEKKRNIEEFNKKKDEHNNNIKTLFSKLQDSKKRRDSNQDQINITELEEKIEESRISLEIYNIERTALLRQLDEIKYLESQMLPSSVFRSFVVKRYLADINRILGDIVPDIIDDVSISLAMDTKQGIDIVMSRSGKWISFKNLSGGEKRRIDGAITLAFQRFIIEISGVSANIIFFDEPFENMDHVGVELIIQCIGNIFTDSCVYIISHNENTKSMFDKSITISKISGRSTIELN